MACRCRCVMSRKIFASSRNIAKRQISHKGRMNSRRQFVRDAALVLGAGFAARPLLRAANNASAETGLVIAGEDGMIVRSLRFLDLEMPPEFASTWLTPVEHFYVRNHMFEPAKIEAAEWKLTVSGEVDKPLTLTLADLKPLHQHSVTNTLECAGNGRAFQSPKVPGIQWQ